jgi:hypothetical protein
MAFITIGKKGAPKPEAAPGGAIPIDRVAQMKQQGLSDNQIIQTLQRDGFSSQQIFDAMSQAEIKGTVAGPAPMPPGQAPPPGPMPPPQMPPPGPAPMGAPIGMPPEDILRDKIEEVVEGIIDEKWQELIDQVNKVIEWKEASEKNIAQIEQKFEDLHREFDKVHSALLERIETGQKAMQEVGTDVKAMSLVFQKALPGFVENVSELSRITEKMGGKPGKVEIKKEEMFVPPQPLKKEAPKPKKGEPKEGEEEKGSVEDLF